jgi:outer membrane protein OmpA-like peptidoglycan-associated protein
MLAAPLYTGDVNSMKQSALRVGCWSMALALALLSPLSAMAEELSASASAEDWVRALVGPNQPAARGFRPTQRPSFDGECEGTAVAAASAIGSTAPSTATSRNLTVVPYQPDKPVAQIALAFADDSDVVPAEGRRSLSRLAQAMLSPELAAKQFTIAGHTSSLGPRERNLRLSCARALAVRRALVKEGVPAERLSAYGFGPDKPLSGLAGDDMANRRVEVRAAN